MCLWKNHAFPSCVIDANGKVVREGKVSSEPTTPIAWLSEVGVTLTIVWRMDAIAMALCGEAAGWARRGALQRKERQVFRGMWPDAREEPHEDLSRGRHGLWPAMPPSDSSGARGCGRALPIKSDSGTAQEGSPWEASGSPPPLMPGLHSLPGSPGR
jgi:hypothetical protein